MEIATILYLQCLSYTTEIVKTLYQHVELAIPYYGDWYNAVLAALIVLHNGDRYDVVQTCYLSFYCVFVSCCCIFSSYTVLNLYAIAVVDDANCAPAFALLRCVFLVFVYYTPLVLVVVSRL